MQNPNSKHQLKEETRGPQKAKLEEGHLSNFNSSLKVAHVWRETKQKLKWGSECRLTGAPPIAPPTKLFIVTIT
jgi:hypothetical protein